MTEEELKEEYERIQAIRENNAKQRVPPVCSRGWTEQEWYDWREWRKPLPPFDEWKKSVSN